MPYRPTLRDISTPLPEHRAALTEDEERVLFQQVCAEAGIDYRQAGVVNPGPQPLRRGGRPKGWSVLRRGTR